MSRLRADREGRIGSSWVSKIGVQVQTLPQYGGSEAQRFVDFNTEANFNTDWAKQIIKGIGIQANPTYLEWK